MNQPANSTDLIEHPMEEPGGLVAESQAIAPARPSPRLSMLGALFDPALVHWRVGKVAGDKTRGMALAYIDARDVMDRLDKVCGPANWSDSYDIHGERIICTLRIKIEEEWIAKSDGAGKTAVEADKGAISDAFKRAGVKWGIGRYLYRLDSPWVKLVNGKYIDDGELPRLQRLLGAPADQQPPPQTGNSNAAPPPQDASFEDWAKRTMAEAEEQGVLDGWREYHRDSMKANVASGAITQEQYDWARRLFFAKTRKEDQSQGG